MSLFKSMNCNPLLFSCIISNICGNFNSSQNFYFSICFNIFTDIFVSSLSFLCYSSSFSFCFLFFFCKLAFFPAILCLLILCLFPREYFLSNVSMQSQDFRSLLYMCIEIRKIVDGLPNLTIFLLMASDHPVKSFTADFEYIYFLTSGHFSFYINWMARSTIPWPLGVFSLATVFQCHPSVEQLWRGFSFLTCMCLIKLAHLWTKFALSFLHQLVVRDSPCRLMCELKEEAGCNISEWHKDLLHTPGAHSSPSGSIYLPVP